MMVVSGGLDMCVMAGGRGVCVCVGGGGMLTVVQCSLGLGLGLDHCFVSSPAYSQAGGGGGEGCGGQRYQQERLCCVSVVGAALAFGAFLTTWPLAHS
jgi:hypothetical protein